MTFPMPKFISANPNFTSAQTIWKGSPSTEKIGTRNKKTGPAWIKCAV